MKLTRVRDVGLFEFLDDLPRKFRVDRGCHITRIGKLRICRIGDLFEILSQLFLSRGDIGRRLGSRFGVFLNRFG